MSASNWLRLGTVKPRDLESARLQLHYAAQLVASVGKTLLAPQPDDSHPNLGWSHPRGALVGRETPDPTALRAALNVGALELSLLGPDDQPVATLALDCRSMEEAKRWLASALTKAGVDVPQAGLTPTGYEIPDHPLAHEGRFSRGPGVDLGEMARWFANGTDAMIRVVERSGIESPVRCWPHHFDVGALLVLESAADGSVAKSVGIGLSPGDGSYAEPYWYVSPWPYPDASALPELPASGHWHTEGFTAAVLTGTDLLEGGPAAEQGARTASFLDAAVDASRRALA